MYIFQKRVQISQESVILVITTAKNMMKIEHVQLFYN